MTARRRAPLLFNDEQVREFVVNGYVVLQPDVPDEVHETVLEKLQFVFDEEFNPGNNILPRVPEMYHILNSPEVQGALISVLGEGFIEHPHRHCHYIPPEPRPAQRQHQDSYTPLGHPRQHYPRYARMMYYPQDTPVELGPTHVAPGTQYNKGVTDEDRARSIPMAGKAGTVSITHFDVIHGAGVSHVNRARHMIKFIYMRAGEPGAPSWNCEETQWRKPRNLQAPYDLDLAWSHIWDWMCGKQDRYESFRNAGDADGDLASQIADLSADRDLETRLGATRDVALWGDRAAEAVPPLVGMLNTDHQAVRVAAIYALGAVGSPAVEPMVEALKASGLREDAEQAPGSWNEGAIAMEDAAHALGAVGPAAVPALIDLLGDDSEWVRINAAFALGEMDSGAADAVPALTRCLDAASHCVVRTATEALGCIRQDAPTFIPALGRLLKEDRPEWNGDERRGWTVSDQVRASAATAFTRLGQEAADAEDGLIEALDDPCGQVATFALDALRRIGSPTSMEAVMEFLNSRRWDESIVKGRLF